MNKHNRRQFIKTNAAAGLMGLIAPSSVLSSCSSKKKRGLISAVPLTIGTVKAFLRIAYWDESKSWVPLDLEQDGTVLKSRGPVKVNCKLNHKAQGINYDLDVQSSIPTRVGMFLSFSELATKEPVFHVLPGLLFGDNNLSNVLDKNAFHHLVDVPIEGKAFSPVWEFRADRCAMPLSAMCNEKAVIAISINPYDESKSDEPITVANGVSSMLADKIAPASCGVSLGYANLPYTYPYQGLFMPSVEDTLLSGKTTGCIYAEASGDRRSVTRFVREEYQVRRALPEIRSTRNEALIASATAMRDVLWSPEDKAFCNLYFDNGASMDTGKSPNEESAHAFIRAARILHELSGDDYYLEALRDGIDLECLWRYGYATKPLVPPLSNSGWNSCGGSVTSVANPCIHPMGIRVSDDLRYYAKITGDQYVYKRWEDGINWSIASLELYPKHTGIGPYGITSERYCQSDGMLYPNFDGGELWSIWNTSHCFGVAAMLEGLVDAVQLKDTLYKI